MSCEHVSNFDQWKTFSENYKPMRVYGLFTYLPRIIVACDFSPSSFKLGILPLSWQNKHPNMKTTWHIKLKFFLWTKLIEKVLLSKYLISVAAALRLKILAKIRKFQENIWNA